MPTRQPTELTLFLRRFEGTNILVDGAFLGPMYLRRSQNWVPGETFRLEKRRGSTAYGGGNLITPMDRCPLLFACKVGDVRYLFAVVSRSSLPADVIFASTDGGTFTSFGGGGFMGVGKTYAVEQVNDALYFSNDTDPILKVTLPAMTTTELVPVGDFTDTSGPATFAADPGAQFLTGTYAYAWAIFDHDESTWLERGTTRQVTKKEAGDQSVSFPGPMGYSVVLGTRYKAHLFVSPVNYPIEFAHDQLPQGLDGIDVSGPVVLRQVIADGPPIPLHQEARKGNILKYHFGRLFIAGDASARNIVTATSTLIPGYEQSLFNAGEFFPYNAKLPAFPEDVTGLGLAATGERGDAAVQSPLVITTLTRTYLFFGDILDDPSASLVLVSRRAGCIGPRAMTETPVGLFYVGLETVYWIAPGGDVPQDVGWPIRPAIKDIPRGVRENVHLTYHKGFLKCFLVPAGGATASVQWWLDLRRGVGSVPSWWGPHQGPAYSAVATSPYEPTEADRLFGVVEVSHVVENLDQPNTYTENAGATTLVSILQTGDLDAGQPFDRKLFKRVRAIGFPARSTNVSLAMTVDGVRSGQWDPLEFVAPEGALWNVAEWNVSKWGSHSFTEGESVSPEERPRGRTVSIQLTHAEAIGLAIRDFEVRYDPIDRPVRSVKAQPNS